MKTFECKVCGHIVFNAVSGICPVCNAAADQFVEKTDVLKRPANPAALTDGDKKHIPEITVVKECGLIPDGSCTDVHVKVGAIKHVMEEKHYIMWLDFYLNSKFISRIQLTPAGCQPAAALHLNAKSGKLAVIENCNIHGKWMAEASL